MDLYNEERPTSFRDVIGQKDACKQLISLGKSKQGIPHCILFSGPSGCGKTTLARIVRNKLKCSDNDFVEINGANDRGVEMVRGIQKRFGLSPMGGKSRVWLIDECHMLTQEAQSALFKLLEEPPQHAYFMLATTLPEKLKKAIQTRATDIKVRSLHEAEIASLVGTVMTKHTGQTLSPDVGAKLAEIAEGSARKALVLLAQIMGIDDVKVQLNILEHQDIKKEAIEIARALLNGSWATVAPIIKACVGEPESIRWLVLAYFTTIALSASQKSGRAIEIIEEFECNYYDTKRAGLVVSCYRACTK